jgi:hypothetical protein
MPRPRGFLLLLLAVLPASGCIKYEYEHEFWLKVNGSGRVHVTGQPWLWNAFKAVGRADDPEATVTTESVRALFERAGLSVRRVTLTHREGRPYIFIAADFDHVSRLAASPAFPDLDIRMAPEGERLRLSGVWRRPAPAGAPGRPAPGLMAVRFHLPSKVYEHHNAAAGVERGNIVAWRQELSAALRGEPLAFGALIDDRSILWSTVGLFAVAIALALATLAAGLYFFLRKGRQAAG